MTKKIRYTAHIEIDVNSDWYDDIITEKDFIIAIDNDVNKPEFIEIFYDKLDIITWEEIK